MIPLPPHASIGPHIYDVFRKKDVGEDRDAEIDYEKLNITIENNLPPTADMVCLFHELTHAWVLPIKEILGEGLEEAVCDLVGLGISELFLRNPGFIQYLQTNHERFAKHNADADRVHSG